MNVWRCDVTGNPVGTDTKMIGAPPCACQGCRAFAEVDRLTIEANRLTILVERQRSAVQLTIDWFLTSKPEVKNMNQPQLIERLRAALSSDDRP